MWLKTNKKIRLTVLNLFPQMTNADHIEAIVGDARCLTGLGNNKFDVVFSNSVIEHLGTWEEQNRMAEEVRRVGKRYFVQTPNYYFPLEPHTLFPFFQFFPASFKIFLLRHFNLGWFKKAVSEKEATEIVNEIRLLKLEEFKIFFLKQKFIKKNFSELQNHS